jgi:hypothetical protein
MDDQEVGIEHARKILGDLAMDARDEGRITFLTHYGHKQENP